MLLMLDILISFQIPHSYQQILSGEKTPTLCGTVPAFKALIQTLEKFQEKSMLANEIIQPGIDKLEDYQAETSHAPAYTLATCEFSQISYCTC
jgi:hypothetical protein